MLIRYKYKSSDAFTIVELLVVIVVIGILAAITIVSYTGISSRANASVLQSDLDNASKQLKLYQAEHSVYPTSLNASNCPLDSSGTLDNTYCLKPGSGITYKYSVDNTLNPKAFSLYATKNNDEYFATNNSTPVSTTQVSATGGAITSLNGYNIHTFTASGTFTVTGGGNVEVLVVGGGGGGGWDVGGGGGAGGLIYNSLYAVTSQTYTITIGTGGAGATSSTVAAINGSDSIFGTLTAVGGGKGGSWSGNSGAAGGSGGGATSNVTGGGGLATSNQGNPGGAAAGNPGSTNQYSGASGGGGAGQAGGLGTASGWSAASTTYGYGGNGLQYSISGTPTYYAGGGGSASDSGSYWGVGGLGGGGGGNAVNATANTGGGGGGGGVPNNGGSGGSGIVIIRYPN